MLDLQFIGILNFQSAEFKKTFCILFRLHNTYNVKQPKGNYGRYIVLSRIIITDIFYLTENYKRMMTNIYEYNLVTFDLFSSVELYMVECWNI